MTISRYSVSPKINFGFQFGTSDSVANIRRAIANGLIRSQTIFLQEVIRLDVLAGQYYGDARYYWIIAAASNIGWSLQVPPNTQIVIPDLEQCLRYLG